MGATSHSGYGPTYAFPTAVHPDTYITSLSSGGDSVLALHNDGTGTAWGNNDFGQLGIGATGTPAPAEEVRMQLPAVVQISAGQNSFGAALDGNGVVYTFGRNSEGELGTRPGGVEPNPLSNLPVIQQISAGNLHMLALAQDGSVWAWGDNHEGQLGDPNNTASTQFFPTKVLNLPQIDKIYTKFDTNFAVDKTGKVWAWGQNSQGQFGAPSSDGVHHGFNAVPQVITGIPLLKQIAPGRVSVTALSTTGQVWTWGNNNDGELGDGSALTSWHSPVAVPGLTNVQSVGSGQNDSYAVINDGSLKGWGWNFAGELGIGNSIQQNTPIAIPGVSNAAGVDASGTHGVTWKTIQVSTASITSVTASVTPASALYEMKGTANFGGVACPARLVTIVGGTIRTDSSLCGVGGTSPTTKDWNFGVLTLPPSSSVTVSVVIDDNNGAKSYDGSITTPKPPVWVAVGDSYSSGHHQDSDEPCGLGTFPALVSSWAENTPYSCTGSTGAFSLAPNDVTYSWATRGRNNLMSALSVPSIWKMQISIVAASGAKVIDFKTVGPPTSSCPGCGETGLMTAALLAHIGSWNIVTINGGANDASFSQTLYNFYNAHAGQDRPWDRNIRADCPDTDTAASNVSSAVNTKAALSGVVSDARTSDANVRLVAITYPYITAPTNVCSSDSATLIPHVGANSVIDRLDSNLVSLATSGVTIVDLRSTTGFVSSGSNPLGIQLTRYFGYPHPDSPGQDAIAYAVNTVLRK